MRLNTMKPGEGSRQAAKRPGRGIGSGIGKTGGRGHKGQKSRSGGYHKVGFEGGQMPLQRRLPKRGFRSRKSEFNAEVRLDQLGKVEGTIVEMATLKAAGLINGRARRVKIIASGELSKVVTVRGIDCTKGARAAIESAGGIVEAAPAAASADADVASTAAPATDDSPAADSSDEAE